MLNISPPNYKFCPMCGSTLSTRKEEDKDRKFCSSCNWMYYPHVVSSAGALIIKDNKVLMVKRNIDPYKGTWMFPSGFLEYGEHPQETIIREVKEETGLDTQSVDLLAVEQAIDDTREPGHNYYIYKVIPKNGEARTNGEENTDIQWIPLDSKPEIGWKVHKEYFKKLQNGDFM